MCPTAMNRLHLLALACLALITLVAGPTVRAAEPKNLQLFLLVGQSNMAGRGKVAPEDQQPHPRVWMLNAAGKWVPAVDPMHFDKPGAGVGPGRAFALALAAADPGVEIGLIPCAHGGSPIAAWQPGAFYQPTKSHPWDDAIRRTKIAMKSGTLKGILWHQGESDCAAGPAATYERKLHELIARFRTELNAPNLPFIAGQMGQFEEKPWSDGKKQVDQAHQDLVKKIPHTGFASAAGLHHKGDAVHFDSDSYRTLGKRYAEAYLKLVPKQ